MRKTLNHSRRPDTDVMLDAAERWLGSDEDAKYLEGAQRPRTRGECEHAERPCPWVSCRHHLALDVRPNGSITFAFPHLDVTEIPQSCALDVADTVPQGKKLPLSELAAALGLSYDRAFQVYTEALKRARTVAADMGVAMEPSRAEHRPPPSRHIPDLGFHGISVAVLASAPVFKKAPSRSLTRTEVELAFPRASVSPEYGAPRPTKGAAAAAEIIREVLGDGEWHPQGEVIAVLEDAGISSEAWKRAKSDLGIQSRHSQWRWWWRLGARRVEGEAHLWAMAHRRTR